MKKQKTTEYKVIDNEDYSDLVAEPQYELFFNTGENERKEEGTLRVLSLFSGCGGMDLGLEGGFICHKHSVTNDEWIHHSINDNWTLLKRNLFRTVFACDILDEARQTWLRYMSRYDVAPEIYHLTNRKYCGFGKATQTGRRYIPPKCRCGNRWISLSRF